MLPSSADRGTVPSSLPPEADGLPVPDTAGSFDEVKADNGAGFLGFPLKALRDRDAVISGVSGKYKRTT